VNGLNAYDLEIAHARIQAFFQKVVRLTEIQRAGTKIDTLVLALEQESGKLVDALHGDRRVDVREFSIPKEHADSEKSA
jgi:hypothetical protein